MPAPNYTPLVRLLDDEHWVGPEAPGRFTYRYTYVWGKKDPELCAPGGFLDPQWESGPSPESEAITVTAMNAAPVEVRLPNIDWEQGFGVSGTLRRGHSGYRKRIDRARVTVGTGGAQPIEASSVYQLIAEVDGLTTTWTDDGSAIPDYFRRIPEVTGYYAFEVFPDPDRRYEIDMRCNRRPERMQNDNDVPAVEASATEALTALFVARLALLDKQLEEHAYWKKVASSAIGTYMCTAGYKTTILPPRHYGQVGYRHPGNQFPLGSFRTVP